VAKKVIHFYFFLLCVGISTQTFCANADLVRNLNQEFLIYSRTYNSLVPITEKPSNVSVVYLRVAASDIANHKIRIKAKNDYCIYVNNNIACCKKKGVSWCDIKDFTSKKFKDDHFFLSFFSPNVINSIDIDLYRSSISNTQIIHTAVSDPEPTNSFGAMSDTKNKYIIGIILSLFTFILLKTLVPNIFERIFKMQIDMSLLTDRSSSKLAYFQNESIFIFLFISILAGIYIYVFLDKDTYVSGVKILNSTHGAALFTYGLMGTFLLFLFKYIIYRLVSFIFGVTAFSKILINEFSKTIFQALLFIYPVYFIINSPYHMFESNAMLKFIYPLVFVLSIFVLKELYYFYRIFNFNKFYIIAYICICDLFPTCIFLKILSQSEFI